MLACSCSTGADLGEPCLESAECMPELQCLNTVCKIRCVRDEECGDGFLCAEGGECQSATASFGETCMREQDCGPRLACMIEGDRDQDGFLDGTCVNDQPDGIVGNKCDAADDCGSAMCIDGFCTQLCLSQSDCPMPFECALIRLDATSKFRGCYPFQPL